LRRPIIILSVKYEDLRSGRASGVNRTRESQE
jgi:hypothetical protein